MVYSKSLNTASPPIPSELFFSRFLLLSRAKSPLLSQAEIDGNPHLLGHSLHLLPALPSPTLSLSFLHRRAPISLVNPLSDLIPVVVRTLPNVNRSPLTAAYFANTSRARQPQQRQKCETLSLRHSHSLPLAA